MSSVCHECATRKISESLTGVEPKALAIKNLSVQSFLSRDMSFTARGNLARIEDVVAHVLADILFSVCTSALHFGVFCLI